jgi:dihydropyrimidine dehydrogenase (NAD+) subunit PreA
MSNTLEVKIGNVTLKNPIIAASATPTWDGLRSRMSCDAGAAAAVPKTFGPSGTWAKHPRVGRMRLVRYNGARIGMVNNELYTTMPLSQWIDSELKIAYGKGNSIIASMVALPDPQETAKNCLAIAKTGMARMFEINVSCPMPHGTDKVGFQMGNDPEACFRQVEAVKKVTDVPVGIKLTPTSFDMVPMARAAESAHADFIVIGNSVRSFAGVDIETGKPYLQAYGGYSGPAIRPITMRHLSEVARNVTTPLIAVGGIMKWEDIVEYVMLGASAVQLCTSIMWDGYETIGKMLEGLEGYVQRKGLSSLEEIKGCALPYIKPIEEVSKQPAKHITLDKDRCQNLKTGGCKLCSKACFYGALSFNPTITTDPTHCDGCGLCTEICPHKALALR